MDQETKEKIIKAATAILKANPDALIEKVIQRAGGKFEKKGEELWMRNPWRCDKEIGSFSVNTGSDLLFFYDQAADEFQGGAFGLYCLAHFDTDQPSDTQFEQVAKDLGISLSSKFVELAKDGEMFVFEPLENSGAPTCKPYKIKDMLFQFSAEYRDERGQLLCVFERYLDKRTSRKKPQYRFYGSRVLADGSKKGVGWFQVSKRRYSNYHDLLLTESLPLLGVHDLSKSSLLMVEGEKCYLAAKQLIQEENLDFSVVAWRAGSGTGSINIDAVQKKSFRKIALWPDNDNSGVEAARTMQSRLLAKSAILDLPNNKPAAWDIADCVAEDRQLAIDIITGKHQLEQNMVSRFEDSCGLKTNLKKFLDHPDTILIADQAEKTIQEGIAVNKKTGQKVKISYAAIKKLYSNKKEEKDEPSELETFLSFSERIVRFDYNPRCQKIIFESETGEYVYNKYTPSKYLLEHFLNKQSPNEAALPKEFESFVSSLTNGNEEAKAYLLDWMAATLRTKLEKYLILAGAKGVGKGVLTDILRSIHGQENFAEAGQKTLKNGFNGHLKDKTLIFFDELQFASGSEEEDAFKLYVNHTMSFQRKGKDEESCENFANVIAATNNVTKVANAISERRYVLMDLNSLTLQEHNPEFFDFVAQGKHLEDSFLQAVADHLFSRKITTDFSADYKSPYSNGIAYQSLPEWQRNFIDDFYEKYKGSGLVTTGQIAEFINDNLENYNMKRSFSLQKAWKIGTELGKLGPFVPRCEWDESYNPQNGVGDAYMKKLKNKGRGDHVFKIREKGLYFDTESFSWESGEYQPGGLSPVREKPIEQHADESFSDVPF